MLRWNEEQGRYQAYTPPRSQGIFENEEDLASIKNHAYDIVLNGYEIGVVACGFMIRKSQAMFELLGMEKEDLSGTLDFPRSA